MTHTLSNHFIDIKGILIKISHIQINNKKPTVIFLHDSLGCIKLWKKFPELLCNETYSNYLIYDRQGYGDSSPFSQKKRNNDYLEQEADILNLLIEKMNLSNCILFGHSDGGSIALIAAAKYPSKIKAVITEGAHVFVEEITLQGIKEALMKKEYIIPKIIKYHGNKSEALFHAWTDTWLSKEYKHWNIERFLNKIICPVLIIQGINDEYGSEKQVDSIVNNVFGISKKLMIPEAAHSPHKENQQVVLKECSNFISQIIISPIP